MKNINSLVESANNENFVNVVSLFFLLFTSILILLIRDFRVNKKIFLIILVAVIFRNILIIVNVFIVPLPGSDKDALGFIKSARDLIGAEEGPSQLFGSSLYEYLMSLTLDYGINSILFIISLNNLIFFISVSLILKILNLLQVTIKYRIICLLILFLYPSLLFNTISTLREPLQFFFITLSAYLYVYLAKRKFSLILFFILNLSVLALGLLHNGMLALTPVIIFIYIYSLYIRKDDIATKIAISSVGLLFILTIILLFISGIISSPLVDSILDGNSDQYTEEYREASPNTRASYSSEVSFSNPVSMFFSSVFVMIGYFIMPLPWQISSVKDFMPVLENIIRLVFLYYIFKNRNFLNPLKIFILVFLIIEFVWALGTSNWGTASRHHIISAQLLLISYIYVKDRVQLYNKKEI